MLRRLIKRLGVGICFGLVVGVLAVTIGEAGSPNQEGAEDGGPLKQEGPVRKDCLECHESVVTHWETSAHGQAVVDSIFQEAWKEKGSPEECLQCHTTNYNPESGVWETDGISCSVCHSGQSGPHPETAMPTDPSSRLCGSCHLDTHSEWQESAHGEGELACVRCHNPHTTDLKIGAVDDLCTACHNDEGHFYDYTAHAKENLLCTDCHLKVSDTPLGEGHGSRVHTLAVDLHTCNECHEKEMHYPATDETTTDAEFIVSSYSSEVEEACGTPVPLVRNEPEPAPAKPLNYLLIAAVGMGFGVAVTPVAEAWYERLIKKD